MTKFLFLILYVVLLLGLGVFASRKVKSMNDFTLAGRNVGPWLSAFSYGTAYFSAVIFVGYAGRNGWNFGLGAVWIGVANAVIGSFLAWKVLAERTRSMTRRLEVTTMPEFFEKRYGSRWMKILSAIIIFAFLTPYSASVYQGIGYLFECVFHIDYVWCMIGMAALALVYLTLGGYMASTFIDLIQGLFMLLGVILMVLGVVSSIGGLETGVSALAGYGKELVSPFGADPMNLLWMVLLTSFGTWGLPQMVHKFYAIRDLRSVKAGTWISTVFALVIGGAAYFVGALGRVVLNGQIPVDPATGAASLERVVPDMLFKTLPDASMALIVILVLSASMSTLSSLMLASSTAISMDLIKGVFRPKMSQKHVQGWMKILIAVFIAISLLIALDKDTPITVLMSLSWGTVAGCCLGPYLYGVCWKKTTKLGAFSGLLSGLIVTVVLALILGISKAPFIGCMAMLSSVVVTPIVSLITPKLSSETIRAAFGEDAAGTMQKV